MEKHKDIVIKGYSIENNPEVSTWLYDMVLPTLADGYHTPWDIVDELVEQAKDYFDNLEYLSEENEDTEVIDLSKQNMDNDSVFSWILQPINQKIMINEINRFFNEDTKNRPWQKALLDDDVMPKVILKSRSLGLKGFN